MRRISTSHVLASLLAFIGSPLVFAGCGKRDAKVTDIPTPEYSVRIDRADNGAVDVQRDKHDDPAATLPRELTFEMTGESRPMADAGSDTRAAAAQAAILDAFVRALIEARHTRGQPTGDFTAQLGPRLVVTHMTTSGGGTASEITLTTRGVEHVFSIKNGDLESPVADMKLIRQIFSETNGEFSLLATDWTNGRRTCQARVGCYLPAGVDMKLVGEPTADPSPEHTTSP